MKKLLQTTTLVLLLGLWIIPEAFAQLTVSGTVTDSEGNEALPGVSVQEKGTSNGTVTDIEGRFTLSVPDENSILVFSFIGYESQEVAAGNGAAITIQLLPDVTELQEVVVTALGIERDKKALGYAVSEVQGESLTQAREPNLTNALVGRVAGLNVNSTSGGPGASSNVIIRGVSSINQTSQPLYVVNGIPMESQPNAQSGGQWDNGPDLGDAVSNLNPDDIESISVLKGAAASALYGYRAKGGVILITTKGAKGNDGIEFNSNYVAEQIMDLSNWQTVYGQGANNKKPANATEAFESGQSSWGGLLDGSNVVQFDGVERPYVAQKDNLENFYRTGGTWTNTLAFNKGFEGGSVRFSASNMTNNSVVPNSGLDRNTFNLAGSFDAFKNLKIDARANYVIENAQNRPMLSDGAGNANYNVMFLPTSLDINTLNPWEKPNGSELSYSNNTFATNPYFAAHNFINDTERNRLIGSISATYTFENGLFIMGRAGRDSYNDRYTNVVPSGTAYRPQGSILERSSSFSDLNVDGLIGKTFDINESRFTISPNLGASYRRTQTELFENNGSDFSVFGIYNILNAENKSVAYNVSDLDVQSVYATLDLSYNELLYLTLTGRQDWFSSLAATGFDNDLHVFYPGVSSSFVFSELWRSSVLSFGKLRLGYAQVGQATGPYETQLYYNFMGNDLNGRPLGQIPRSEIPNSGLKPSLASEFELGTDLRFFNNRVGLDLTYYHKLSENEIVRAPASSTSGYSSAILNAGEMKNEGVEALLSVTPVQTQNFNWTTSLNGSYNKNTVVSLAAGQTTSVYATSRSGAGFVGNEVGLPFGQIMAYDYAYNEEGEIEYNSNGVPERGELTSFGTAFHPWTGGWSNDFNYKGINLSVLIDGKFGGKIFSATDYYGYVFGLHQETLVGPNGEEGRDHDYSQGVAENPVNAGVYYSNLANNHSARFVENADFIKFRQFTLGYTFPSAVFNNKIQSLSLSLVGRNLFILMRKTENIDPEASYTALGQGLELGGVPPVRSVGLNLNIRL